MFEHRKSLAHQATLLHFSELTSNKRLKDTCESDLQEILLGLASQLITSRNELSQFPITYYFHENESETALARIMPYLADIAEQNATCGHLLTTTCEKLCGRRTVFLKPRKPRGAMFYSAWKTTNPGHRGDVPGKRKFRLETELDKRQCAGDKNMPSNRRASYHNASSTRFQSPNLS